MKVFGFYQTGVDGYGVEGGKAVEGVGRKGEGGKG